MENKANQKGKLYAVLAQAIDDKDYTDIPRIKSYLLKAGIKSEDVYLLHGKDEETKFTEDNLEKIIDDLARRIIPKDRLLFYLTGHGMIINGRGYVSCYGEDFSEGNFERVIKKLPKVEFAVFMFTQCFSELFAKRIGKRNNISISNSNQESRGVANVGPELSEYLFPKILKEGEKIQKVFKFAVKKENCLINKISYWTSRLFGEYQPKDNPKIYWEDSNPSELYLIEK
jgi:hypothetical protein